MCAFAFTSVDRNALPSSELLSGLGLPSLLQQHCYRLWECFTRYAWSAEEQADIPDEPDIPEAQLHIAEPRSTRLGCVRSLTGEFSLGDEDPAWLNLQQAAPGFVFSPADRRLHGGQRPQFRLNFHGGFRTPVRVDGVVEYRVRDSPIVRFVSARAIARLPPLIPVDHDTFRVPPLARITLERIDEPREWSANGHVQWQRCYTVSLSYG